MHRRTTTSANLIKGAVAGVVATAVLDLVTNYLYAQESRSTRAREDRARSGKTAYETAAEKLAGMFGARLSRPQRKRLGGIIHWTLGIGAGAAYATYARRRPSLRRGFGAGFGTAFWAAVDEGLVSLLGLTPPPRAFPAATHLRGLAGHLAFGVTADRTLRLLDAIA
jgi:Protein of unknown function (DUF1440)